MLGKLSISEIEELLSACTLGRIGCSVEGKTYVVRQGDTLWAIAQQLYGDPYKYKRLFEANPRVLAAPEHIFPGQVLRVPA